MNESDLFAEYSTRYRDILVPLAEKLEVHLRQVFTNVPRIDRISARAKSPERFLEKAQKTAEDGTPKYSEPLGQIQDQIGARVVAFYLPDVENLITQVCEFFRSVEDRRLVPDEPSKF